VAATIPEELRGDVETLWDYHNMHHELRKVDVGIGLGSHDIGVAIHATDLYNRAYFPTLVFTGGNAPTTIERFPAGEAQHYRDYAVEHGVPAAAILLEPRATNTGENIRFSQHLLRQSGVHVTSALLISRPYQQRRAYATAKKMWPELDVICTSLKLSLDEYVESIGDVSKVVNMLVGDTQRIDAYATRGFAVKQHMPSEDGISFRKLVSAGFADRLVPEQ
jgi:hypothetical protein